MFNLPILKKGLTVADVLEEIKDRYEYVDVEVNDFSKKSTSYFLQTKPYGVRVWDKLYRFNRNRANEVLKKATVYYVYKAYEHDKLTYFIKAYGRTE